MVEVFDPGTQAQKRSQSLPPLESLLLPFLTPCGTVKLFNHVVAACCVDHQLVVDIDQDLKLPDRGSALISTDRIWDTIFAE